MPLKRSKTPATGKAKPKTGKVKRKKLQSLPSLITKADNLASKYIRQKYSDENGMVHCVSCPTVLHWKEAHNAHWIGRAAKSVRWDERNLAPACPACNVYRKEAHAREYTLFQLDRWGRDGIEEIKADSRKVLRGSEVRQLAEDAILYFSTQLKEFQP